MKNVILLLFMGFMALSTNVFSAPVDPGGENTTNYVDLVSDSGAAATSLEVFAEYKEVSVNYENTSRGLALLGPSVALIVTVEPLPEFNALHWRISSTNKVTLSTKDKQTNTRSPLVSENY